MIQDRGLKESRWISIVFVLVCIGAGTALGYLVPYSSSALKTIAIVVGIIGLGVALARLEVGLYALVFIAYLQISDIGIRYHGMPSILQPFLALVAGVILIEWIRFGIPNSSWLRSVVVVVAYGLVLLASVMNVTSINDFMVSFIEYIKNGIIVVFLTIMIRRWTAFKGVLWVLVTVGIVTGTISVFQYLTGTFTNNYWGLGQASVQTIITGVDDYRVGGMIGDPNYYAQTLVVLVPIGFEMMLSEKKFWLRVLAGLSSGLTTLAILFSFSRGGAVALAVVVMGIVFYRLWSPKYLIAIALLLIAVGSFLPENYLARLATIPQTLTGQLDVRNEDSFRGRVSELVVAMQMFADHPILGVGLANYPVHYQEYSQKIGLDPRPENRQPHNLYLEVAAETGILGLLVFFGILYSVYQSIRSSWSMLRAARLAEASRLVVAFGIGVLGYFSAAMFIHGAYPRYLWVLVGIALALPEATRTAIEKSKQMQKVA